MLQLYITRSKIFISLDESGTERRFTLGRSTTPQAAPDWVRDTVTFKYGIRDKSIVDLTPPKPVVVKAAPTPESPELVEGDADPDGPDEVVAESGTVTEDAQPEQAPAGKKSHKGGRAASLGLK